MSKPLILYSHAKNYNGPNPWKVVIILEELVIPYTTKHIDTDDMTKAPYETDICVNGRVPAIEDPNTGVVIWESGAIVEYLVDQYDTLKTLTYTTIPEKYLVSQWLHFQMSGQGPYYGQAAWFVFAHEKTLPIAIERYRGQVKRVVSVLNKALEGREWLVGDKCTIADLSFVTWDVMLPFLLGRQMFDGEKEFVNFEKWHRRVLERPSVRKAFADKKAFQPGLRFYGGPNYGLEGCYW